MERRKLFVVISFACILLIFSRGSLLFLFISPSQLRIARKMSGGDVCTDRCGETVREEKMKIHLGRHLSNRLQKVKRWRERERERERERVR